MGWLKALSLCLYNKGDILKQAWIPVEGLGGGCIYLESGGRLVNL